jgi:hypothetical protein
MPSSLDEIWSSVDELFSQIWMTCGGYQLCQCNVAAVPSSVQRILRKRIKWGKVIVQSHILVMIDFSEQSVSTTENLVSCNFSYSFDCPPVLLILCKGALFLFYEIKLKLNLKSILVPWNCKLFNFDHTIYKKSCCQIVRVPDQEIFSVLRHKGGWILQCLHHKAEHHITVCIPKQSTWQYGVVP